MDKFLTNLADYLEDQAIGTVGTNIFLGELPVDKSNCIALSVAPSPEPNNSIPYYVQTVDFWARYDSYAAGYAKLAAVLGLLHQVENFEFNHFHVYLCHALSLINDNGRDEQSNHLFQLSLSFIYRVAEEVS